MAPRHTTALLVAVLLSMTAVAPASANEGETIIHRCLAGESLSGFSQSAYRQALGELGAGAEEYSDCSSLIRQAQLAAARGNRGDSSASAAGVAASAVPVVASPSEQKAVTHAAHAASGPVQLGAGEPVVPGVVHTNVSSALSSLPTPLLATLAFLLACLLLAAGALLRNRVRARRSG